MNKKHLILLLITTLVNITAFGQNQNEQAMKAMKKAIGSVINKYVTYSSPTNNFGVGTSCLTNWVPKGTMICDMVKCFGLDRNDQNTDAWRSVNGFAFYGNAGSLVVDDSLNRNYGIGMILPKLLKVLNLNVDMNLSRITSVKLTIDSAVLRYLDYDKYSQYASTSSNRTLKNAWVHNQLVLVTSDYVLLDYSFEINPVDSFGVTLITKLDSLGNAKTKLFTGNDSLGIKFERRSGGSFTVKSTKPVVFAVLIKKKKNIEGMGRQKNFDKWDNVAIEDSTVDLASILVPDE